MIFKTKYLANLLWIVWYDYMKISKWLICVENDIYLSMKYFLLYLECEKPYAVDDGKYMYVDWLCNCWWIHVCWLIVKFLVNTYMLNLLRIAYILCGWWWCGELFVWTYALLSSHMFMHSWLMVTDYISNWGDYDVQLASWGWSR